MVIWDEGGHDGSVDLRVWNICYCGVWWGRVRGWVLETALTNGVRRALVQEDKGASHSSSESSGEWGCLQPVVLLHTKGEAFLNLHIFLMSQNCCKIQHCQVPYSSVYLIYSDIRDTRDKLIK